MTGTIKERPFLQLERHKLVIINTRRSVLMVVARKKVSTKNRGPLVWLTYSTGQSITIYANFARFLWHINVHVIAITAACPTHLHCSVLDTHLQTLSKLALCDYIISILGNDARGPNLEHCSNFDVCVCFHQVQSIASQRGKSTHCT